MARSDDFYLLGTVPVENFGNAWEALKGFLVPAFRAAKNTDPFILRWLAVAGVASLWAVYRINPLEPKGAFFTEIIEDVDGRRIMFGHTMSGSDLRRWAHLAQGAVEAEARKRNCCAVQIMGRRGLLRIYPGYRIVGEARPGEWLFERVLA